MAATDVTLPEVSAALPDGVFKTWFDARLTELPANWTFGDVCASMIQGAIIAQGTKNTGVTNATDRLATYASTVATPVTDAATGQDNFRKTYSVVMTKALGSFDGTQMFVVSA